MLRSVSGALFPGSGLLSGTCLSAVGAGVLLLIETAVLILQRVIGLLKNKSPPHWLRLGQWTFPWDSMKRNAKPWPFPSDELKDITECELCFYIILTHVITCSSYMLQG